MNTELILALMRSAVVDSLRADALFDDLAIVEVLDGDLASLVANAAAGILESQSNKRGLTLLVHTPSTKRLEDVEGGFPRAVCAVKLTLWNSRFINFSAQGPQIEPSAMSARVFWALINRTFGHIAGSPTIYADSDDGFGEELTEDGKGNLFLADNIKLSFNLPRGALPRVATPKGVLEGTLALSCTTPGAAIYYTVSAVGQMPPYPSPRTGTLYTDPLSFSQETEICFAAFKDGYYGSEMVARTVARTVAGAALNEDGTAALNEDDTPVQND